MLDSKTYLQHTLSFPPIYVQAYSDDYRTPLWMIIDYIREYKKLHSTIKNSGTLSGIPKSKFDDIGIVLNVKKGSHKGSSGDSIQETSEKIAFIEWLSQDLTERSKL